MIGAIFAGMIILLLLAVPICVVVSMICLIPYGLDPTFAASPMFILRNMVSGLDSITLIAIPMFVLSGIIMARGGISKKLFNVFSILSATRPAVCRVRSSSPACFTARSPVRPRPRRLRSAP